MSSFSIQSNGTSSALVATVIKQESGGDPE